MFRNTRQLVLVMAIAANLLSWTIMADRAFACSCVRPGPPAVELENATAVFAGKVVAFEAPGNFVVIIKDLLKSTGDPVEVTFQVREAWKGPVQSQLVVTTSRLGASCGYEFEEGHEYLVYSRGTPSKLTVSLCSRTQPLATAVEDSNALGTGTHPTVQTPEQSSRAHMLTIVIAVVVSAALLLAVGGLAIKRLFSRSTG